MSSSSTISPLVPTNVAKSTFALFWGTNSEEDPENLFLGTAFSIAPCVALTAAHHIRLSHDDCGRLNLRDLGNLSSNSSGGVNEDNEKRQDEEEKVKSTKKSLTSTSSSKAITSSSSSPSRRKSTTAVMKTHQRICARVSYVQKDRDVDILIMWLDRPVSNFVPLRAFHPLVGQKIMLVSAAITEPHSDVVISTGTVTKSSMSNPDATTTLCRAQGLVSARGYSGSLVLEYLGASPSTLPSTTDVGSSKASNKTNNSSMTDHHSYVFTPLPKQRVLGMHVSVYRDKTTKDNIEAEFVSAYRILKTMAVFNVDVFSSYARGTAAKSMYQLPRNDTTRNTKLDEKTVEKEVAQQKKKTGTKKLSGRRRTRED